MDTLLLDRNENQYGPAPACYKVLREANLEQLSLYSRAYAAGKKSDLSERLSRDLGIPERNVLLSYGSEDMLKQVVHCYLHAGTDHSPSQAILVVLPGRCKGSPRQGSALSDARTQWQLHLRSR